MAATSTAAKFAYRAPVLLSPTNGMLISGRDTPVMLTWASVGILGRDEWYLLRIWTPTVRLSPSVWTKATSYRVPRGLYPGDRRTHRLSWQVCVVNRPTEADPSVAISRPSARYTLIWR